VPAEVPAKAKKAPRSPPSSTAVWKKVAPKKKKAAANTDYLSALPGISKKAKKKGRFSLAAAKRALQKLISL